MNKKQITEYINKYKIVFIGEIHGVNIIYDIVYNIILNTQLDNDIFCVELPLQAEKILNDYLSGYIKKEELFKSSYLIDALNDNRLNINTLNFYSNIYKLGFVFKCLEDYSFSSSEKDKSMAVTFKNILKNY